MATRHDPAEPLRETVDERADFTMREPAGPVDTAFSLMITRRQRAELRVRGLTEDAIGRMTPTEAHALLRVARLER